MTHTWALGQWLRVTLFTSTARPTPNLSLVEAALPGAIDFEQAYSGYPELDDSLECQRLRTAQELAVTAHRLLDAGIQAVPRQLLLDLSERVEALFGDAQGACEVATNVELAGWTMQERKSFLWGSSLVCGVVCGLVYLFIEFVTQRSLMPWGLGLGMAALCAAASYFVTNVVAPPATA